MAVLYECALRHDSGGKSRVRRVLAERSDSARKAVPAVSRLAAANIPSGTPPARPAATTTTWLVWTSLASNSLGRYELPGETENGFLATRLSCRPYGFVFSGCLFIPLPRRPKRHMRTSLHECDTFSWPSAHPGRRWTCGPHDTGPLEVRIYHPLCLQRCEEVVPLSQSAWRVWPKEGTTSYPTHS